MYHIILHLIPLLTIPIFNYCLLRDNQIVKLFVLTTGYLILSLVCHIFIDVHIYTVMHLLYVLIIYFTCQRKLNIYVLFILNSYILLFYYLYNFVTSFNNNYSILIETCLKILVLVIIEAISNKRNYNKSIKHICYLIQTMMIEVYIVLFIIKETTNLDSYCSIILVFTISFNIALSVIYYYTYKSDDDSSCAIDKHLKLLQIIQNDLYHSLHHFNWIIMSIEKCVIDGEINILLQNITQYQRIVKRLNYNVNTGNSIFDYNLTCLMHKYTYKLDIKLSIKIPINSYYDNCLIIKYIDNILKDIISNSCIDLDINDIGDYIIIKIISVNDFLDSYSINKYSYKKINNIYQIKLVINKKEYLI